MESYDLFSWYTYEIVLVAYSCPYLPLEFTWKKCLSFREKFLEFEFLGPWVFEPMAKNKPWVW